MRRKRSTDNGPDHRGKKRYKEEKDVMHKRRKKEKPE
jgi:hypothetical protein